MGDEPRVPRRHHARLFRRGGYPAQERDAPPNGSGSRRKIPLPQTIIHGLHPRPCRQRRDDPPDDEHRRQRLAWSRLYPRIRFRHDCQHASVQHRHRHPVRHEQKQGVGQQAFDPGHGAVERRVRVVLYV